MDQTSKPSLVSQAESEQTPFEKFQDLTKGLLAVPKRELDEKLAEEKAKKQKAKAVKG